MPFAVDATHRRAAEGEPDLLAALHVATIGREPDGSRGAQKVTCRPGVEGKATTDRRHHAWQDHGRGNAMATATTRTRKEAEARPVSEVTNAGFVDQPLTAAQVAAIEVRARARPEIIDRGLFPLVGNDWPRR